MGFLPNCRLMAGKEERPYAVSNCAGIPTSLWTPTRLQGERVFSPFYNSHDPIAFYATLSSLALRISCLWDTIYWVLINYYYPTVLYLFFLSLQYLCILNLNVRELNIWQWPSTPRVTNSNQRTLDSEGCDLNNHRSSMEEALPLPQKTSISLNFTLFGG